MLQASNFWLNFSCSFTKLQLHCWTSTSCWTASVVNFFWLCEWMHTRTPIGGGRPNNVTDDREWLDSPLHGAHPDRFSFSIHQTSFLSQVYPKMVILMIKNFLTSEIPCSLTKDNKLEKSKGIFKGNIWKFMKMKISGDVAGNYLHNVLKKYGLLKIGLYGNSNGCLNII